MPYYIMMTYLIVQKIIYNKLLIKNAMTTFLLKRAGFQGKSG